MCALLFSILLLPTVSLSATPPGTIVSNTAWLEYTMGGPPTNISSNQVSFTVLAPVAPTPATIRLLQLDETTGSQQIPQTSYSDDATTGGNLINISPQPQPGELVENSAYYVKDLIIIEVEDLDENINPVTPETLFVTVRSSCTGDQEVLLLTESAINSGVFIGYLPADATVPVGPNGTLTVQEECEVLAQYTDKDDGDFIETDKLVDPFGIVFDSKTGAPLDGVTVTLINDANGMLADVYLDDTMTTPFPASVTTGDPTYGFSSGGYHFPFIEPGNYRLVITQPAGYAAPSSIPEVQLQILPGAPFAIDANGSYSAPFTVRPGPAIRIDIPLDPTTRALWIRKAAGRRMVAIGDFLQYTLSVENTNSLAAAPEVTVSDTLPVGFRYQSGSLHINGSQVGNPDISGGGRTLTFNIGDIQPSSSVEIDYVVEVTAGSIIGNAVNSATATGPFGSVSNTGRATVKVINEFLSNRAILMGRVVDGACDIPGPQKNGLEKIRIYLEDGTYVDTDKKGMFHFEGVEPGVHVVQVDTATLPEGYEMIPCEQSSQFAGRSFSQFVDLQGGTLWNVHFYAAPTEPSTSEITINMDKQSEEEALNDRVNVGADNSSPAGHSHNHRVDLTVQTELSQQPKTIEPITTNSDTQRTLSTGSTDKPFAQEQPDSTIFEEVTKSGILWPADGATLVDTTTAIRFRIDTRLTPKLSLDGTLVPEDRLGMTYADQETGLTHYSYVSVDLGNPGQHLLKLEGFGPFGNVRFEDTVNVTRNSDIVAMRLIHSGSNIADGRTPVTCKVELLDSHGKTVSTQLDIRLENTDLLPYGKSADELETYDRETQSQSVQVGTDGILRFEPVMQSGSYTATLTYKDISEEITLYIKPHMRDWVLVGFAEGTVGYNTFSGNQISLEEAGIDEHYYDDSQLKFFAKGAIKGEWLLTMAYDSDKPDLDGDSLYQIIDPDSYYPLYGDGTNQGYEASSAHEIYIKLEREQFYALFGDMNTGLNQTELTRYERNMSGFKSELQTYNFSYTMFAADTKQAFIKDEIRGDGTSGRYYLTQKSLVINSEEITLETRDRFRSEIITDTRTLQRHTDYDIDYDNGSLFFKRPVPSKDKNFDPVFIVVRYETYDSDDENLNYGGRAAVKVLDQKVELGASYVHEERGAGEGDLYGFDATVKLTPQTRLHLEAARTENEFFDEDANDDAYLAEIAHDDNRIRTRAYYREQGEKFGLGQQNLSENGTRKYGAEASYHFTPKFSVAGLAYREHVMANGNDRDVGELDARYQAARFGLHGGFRHAKDRLGDGGTMRSEQVLVGGNWVSANTRLNLRADHEQSLNSRNKNVDYPTRTILGADYQINSWVSAFAEQEFTWGEEQDTEGTRVGFNATPWQGGNVRTTVERQMNENGQRVFAVFGLGQTWRINESWSIDAALDRSYTVTSNNNYQFNDNVPTAQGSDDDFTAVSIGSTYRKAKWTWWNRLETRQADDEDKYGVSTSVVGEPKDGVAVSAKALAFITDVSNGIRRKDGNVRMGMAYRPANSRWILLNRLDFYFDREDHSAKEYDNWRIVNNLHANFRLNRRVQMSFYYGLKYVRDNYNGSSYSGYTDLASFEARYNINKRWDLGVHGSILHSWNSDTFEYSAGADIGYSPMTNTWVSLGYNIIGFEDEDFSGADYTAQGVYMRFRAKFDQQSVRDAAEWMNR